MRPAWWREFLQKVKMFFYGFKGFSNYRFTDREIETLLLRGYRKTRNARGAKAEGGEMRFSIDGETKIFSLSELLQRFKDELSGTELNAEQQGIYDVVTGESKKTVIRKEDLETLEEFVLLKGGRGKGAKKIIQVHYAGVRGPVTALEIVNIGDVVRRGTYIPGDEAHPTSRSYELTADDGARLRVVVDYDKQKNKSVINFYSNRKNGNRAHEASSGSITDSRITIAPESGKVKHSPEGGARFSIIGEEGAGRGREAEKRPYYQIPFSEGLVRVVDPAQKDKREPVFVCTTPEIMRKIGFTALPIMMNARHLRLNYYTAEEFREHYGNLHKEDHAHGLHEALKTLPKVLEHPLAVVVNMTENAKPGSVVVITDMDIGGKKVVVPVLIETVSNTNKGDIDSHLVLTVYDSKDWINTFLKPALEEEKKNRVGIFYFDEKKASRYSVLSKNKKTITAGYLHTIHDEGSPVKGNFKKQTETLQFKEWFGKSKVVDEEGKPLVVYHGSTADFTEFSYKFANRNGQADGRGFYFTDNRSFAEGYQNKDGKLFEVYLSIQKPLNPDKLTITKAELRKILDAIDPSGDYMTNYAEDDRGYPGAAWRAKALNRTVNAIYDSSENNADILAELYGSFGGGEVLAEVRKVSGYDGFIKKDQNGNMIYIAFEPGQVKSATDNIGTFDPENPDIRFSIEQYSDADWSDMVTYMRSKLGDVLNHPDSDYRRILEEAGMRCYSEADAHACAAEAMQQNERELRERGKQRRDNWIYENELLYRLVVDFAGSDKFTLVPDSFTGEKFTGSWIAEEYRKYSEKRAQKPTESDKQYKRYLQTREKALARAKGYRLDEVAEAIARKTGRDTLEVQEELVDYQNLKEGTSWGREGAARRLAAMTLDSIERV